MTEGFEYVCDITADLSGLVKLASSALVDGAEGKKYLKINFTVGVEFGGTELRAYVQWAEDVRLTSFKQST